MNDRSELQKTGPKTSKNRLDFLNSDPIGYGNDASQFPLEFGRMAYGEDPFKGTDSYQFEDSPLFFGRAREEREMASLFLKGRLCILHAQSGAGKTSILNARVIPRIGQSGIHVVRLTPQGDPLEAVRVASILQLVPPPECEAQAIEAMLKHAPELENEPLEIVLDRFDDIQDEDPVRRELLAAFEIRKFWFDHFRISGGSTTPIFCKLLGGTVDIRGYWNHFGAFFSFDGIGETIRNGGWKGATVGEIHSLMNSPHARAAHREWIEELDLPEAGFVQFFRNLWQQWAAQQTGFAVCLIIDQFEQIFTLYTDEEGAGPAQDDDKPDWRLRPRFFAELRRLLSPAGADRTVLPISVVLSMRDEYVGQLASVPALASNRDTSYYRLDYLMVADAQRSIQHPARAFGYDYDDEIYDDIISSLKREDRYVKPAHIQIVCDKIWRLFGKDLADQSTEVLQKVPIVQFMEQTGGTVQILQDYFKEILNQFEDTDQLDILDMLSDLLTQSSKRNVVEYNSLVGGALRNRTKRAELIEEMERSGIVRQEARMGSQFVEIAHEFLIDPLQAELHRKVSGSERAFRFAQRAAANAFASVAAGSKSNLRDLAEDLTDNTVITLINNSKRCSWTKDVLDLLVHAGVQKGLSREQFRVLLELHASIQDPNQKASCEDAVDKERI